jgi:hypothetical protein
MKTMYINPKGYAVAAALAGVPVETAAASTPAFFKQVLIAAPLDASGVKHIGYPLPGWKVRAGAVTGPVDIHRNMVLCMHRARSGSIVGGLVVHKNPAGHNKKALKEHRSSERVFL